MATKRRKVNRGKIMGCVLLVAGVVMWGLLVGQIYRIYHRSLDLQNAEARLNALEKQCELIAQELELLDDENYITRYARENWIFTKEGETVIPLPEDEITSDNE